MEVTIVPRGNTVAVAELAGDLNLLCASDVRARLAAAVDNGHRQLVVDLRQVGFIDSSGLGALIGGLKSARQAGGDLRIANPGEQARVVLRLTSLDRVLRPYDSIEDALAAF
jgi:anti-anti-sigma factor